MAEIGPLERIVAQAFEDDMPFVVELDQEPIYRGTLSRVYRGKRYGESSSKESPVAVKVVRANRNSLVCQLFQRELRAVRRARHGHILPFIGRAEFDDILALVSPWMPGGDLFQYLVHNRSANPQRWLLQVAEAVSHLHHCVGLVHGDLKCQNVLISGDGNALLGDFGLSTMVEKLSTDETTQTGIRMCHTVRFAAPELLFGDVRSPNSGRVRSKTQATDMYAFGMLMLQAFSRQKPWPDYDGLPLWVHLSTGPTHPRPDCPRAGCSGQCGLTDTWWQVCVACWSPDPARRPAMNDVCITLAIHDEDHGHRIFHRDRPDRTWPSLYLGRIHFRMNRRSSCVFFFELRDARSFRPNPVFRRRGGPARSPQGTTVDFRP